jgi:hypothetical protein
MVQYTSEKVSHVCMNILLYWFAILLEVSYCNVVVARRFIKYTGTGSNLTIPILKKIYVFQCTGIQLSFCSTRDIMACNENHLFIASTRVLGCLYEVYVMALLEGRHHTFCAWFRWSSQKGALFIATAVCVVTWWKLRHSFHRGNQLLRYSICTGDEHASVIATDSDTKVVGITYCITLTNR